MKKGKRFISALLGNTLLFGAILQCGFAAAADGGEVKMVFAETYAVPTNGNKTWWRDGMVTGNGENAAILSGAPTDERIIYQHIMFNMPNDDLRDTPVLSSSLESVRQNLMQMTVPSTNWDMQYDYTFHPGHQLRIQVNNVSGAINGYRRATNYETAEVSVEYSDNNGLWKRNTFASREDNVVITHITRSSANSKVNITLSIDDISDMSQDRTINSALRYKRIVPSDGSYLAQIGHYPEYQNSELKNGGCDVRCQCRRQQNAPQLGRND
ncbi:MAG: glycoside hydrolase N-terminal domain-containing protein [Clostridia bacterium]|nr:glycoside hydrolase N-terminal domain-containing protein [Clostridia bacterium]